MICVRVQSWSEEACSFEVCCSNTTGHRLKLYMLSNNLEGMHPIHAKTENHCMVRKKYYSEIADISNIIANFATDNSSGQGEIPDRR